MRVNDNSYKWIKVSPEMRKKARQLRQKMTPAEKILWPPLRNREVGGLKFRRQHPFGPYIFDFFCHELRLVVELDGSIHDKPTQCAYDAERDAWCKACALTVLRFTNTQVFMSIDEIFQAILEVKEAKSRPPAPLPKKKKGIKTINNITFSPYQALTPPSPLGRGGLGG